MDHQEAIEFIKNKLREEFGSEKWEVTGTNGVRFEGLIPDIIVKKKDSHSMIVCEVGTTQAEKVKIYLSDKTVLAFRWYDKDGNLIVNTKEVPRDVLEHIKIEVPCVRCGKTSCLDEMKYEETKTGYGYMLCSECGKLAGIISKKCLDGWQYDIQFAYKTLNLFVGNKLEPDMKFTAEESWKILNLFLNNDICSKTFYEQINRQARSLVQGKLESLKGIQGFLNNIVFKEEVLR